MPRIKKVGIGLTGGMLWALDGIILNRALIKNSRYFADSFKSAVFAAGFHDTVSAMVLLVCFALNYQRNRERIEVSKKSVPYFTAGAICGGPVGMTAYLFSIGRTGAGYAAAVSAVYPVIGALLEWGPGGKHFTRLKKAGLLITVAGAVIISAGTTKGNIRIYGLLPAFVAAACWGTEGVVSSRGMKHDKTNSSIGLLIRQSVSSSVYLLILFPLLGIYHFTGTMLLDPAKFYIAIAGCCGTASYLCYYKAIERIGPSTAMMLNVTYTAWTALLESLNMRRLPSLSVTLCIALVFAGNLLTFMQPKGSEY